LHPSTWPFAGDGVGAHVPRRAGARVRLQRQGVLPKAHQAVLLAHPRRPLRYRGAPLFALAGILFAAALFAFSSSASPPSYYPAAHARFNHLFVASRGQRPLPDSVGGKVPLGLKRRALRVLVTGGAGFVGTWWTGWWSAGTA
jgi:hypothetical protein